jgi:DNA polymerase-3 subunit epsilon
VLRVVRADDAEAAAHAGVLAELDKASGGKTIWRKLEVPVA